jgi:carbonic anhydrase
MTSTVELYDKAIISRQPNFDERKTRSEFRKVIPNLKTVVVHCFDPRVTGGIPPAVAKALPGQVYPGEVFEFVGEDGKKKIGSNTTIFPVVVAGGRAFGSAQRSISIACHLFDIRQRRHRASHGLWRDALHPGRILGNLQGGVRAGHHDRDVRSVRTSRGTPRHANVFGFLYDIETGQLLLVEEKPGDPTAPRGAPWR